MPALGWVATIAAAIVLSVVTTSLIVGNRVDSELADQAETISALEEVTTTALAVNAQPDEQHVALAGVSDPTLAGSLTFSPSTTELVWLASGLDAAVGRPRVPLLGRGRRDPPSRREDVLQPGPGLLGR